MVERLVSAHVGWNEPSEDGDFMFNFHMKMGRTSWREMVDYKNLSDLNTAFKASNEEFNSILSNSYFGLNNPYGIRIKNDTIYFMSFRFIGGGGTPYAIQNILPILFDMSVKNYVIATFVGSMPSMFVTVALGSGIEKVIDQNAELSISSVLFSPEIYVPTIVFFIILIIAFVIRKFYFKH